MEQGQFVLDMGWSPVVELPRVDFWHLVANTVLNTIYKLFGHSTRKERDMCTESSSKVTCKCLTVCMYFWHVRQHLSHQVKFKDHVHVFDCVQMFGRLCNTWHTKPISTVHALFEKLCLTSILLDSSEGTHW